MTRHETEQCMKARNWRELKVILGILMVLVGLAAVMTDWS